jgi:hypothetical protein
MVAALAVAAFLIGGVVERSRHHPAPRPGRPTNVVATATTCAPPACRPLGSRVTIAWTLPPGGGPISRSLILRDGTAIKELRRPASDPIRFVDEGVVPGTTHTYTVVTENAAGRSKSRPATVIAPLPPLESAQLDGSYRVVLTVRRAVNLATLEGIAQPTVGRGGRSVWVFTPVCSGADRPCGTDWRGYRGTVRRDGASWSGTVAGRRASCFGGVTVGAPVRLALRADAAAIVDGAWVVTRFAGRSSVRFHCAGYRPSHGTVAVVAHRV